MLIDWLYRSTWEISVLVSFIIIINPGVRRTLNARVAYWLWLIPLATVILWDKPIRPETFMDINILAHGGVELKGIFNSDTLTLGSATTILWIWLSGASIYMLFRIVTWVRFSQLLARYTTPYFPCSNVIANIPAELKPETMHYYRSSLPGGPFVTGIPRPHIYLPNNFEESFSAEQQKWILVHELTHIQRKDLWAQLALECVKASFWFNPLLYFATPYFREDQELACDYQALKNCGTRERAQYGEAMLQEMSANLLPATLAFFTLKKERFIMLQKHKKSKLRNTIGGMLCFGLATFALTEAPTSVAFENNTQHASSLAEDNLSLDLEGIPLEIAVDLVTKFMKKELIDVYLLGDEETFVHAKLDQVPAEKALDFLLSCNNFSYVKEGSSIRIIQEHSGKYETLECQELLGS